MTFVHRTQTVKLFENTFTRFCTLCIWGGPAKFHEDQCKGTPPPGALNTRGVGEAAKQANLGVWWLISITVVLPINRNMTEICHTRMIFVIFSMFGIVVTFDTPVTFGTETVVGLTLFYILDSTHHPWSVLVHLVHF